MVSVKRLKLPGYEFPAALETEICREYKLTPVKKNPNLEKERLGKAWLTRLKASMEAGTVEKTEERLLSGEELLVYRAESSCTEMIARLVPLEEPKEGEIP